VGYGRGKGLTGPLLSDLQLSLFTWVNGRVDTDLLEALFTVGLLVEASLWEMLASALWNLYW
jgi:hypothetical protein